MFVFALIGLSAASTHGQSKIESVYTDLASSKCRTLEVDKETGASVQSCAGVGGYKLLVLDDDSRQSITVVDRAGKKHELDYWQVVTTGFFSVSEKAEWRAVRKNGKLNPLALIVRVNATEDAENPNRVTSYLAVAKITASTICVTNKLQPGANANELARRAADSAQSAPCLKDSVP
ncbi:MAG: hypothetical protein ACRD6N_09030 [Pyrinomonadaceae bacterium]